VRLGVPDLGAGDLFGSSMANMLILAILGFLRPVGGVFRQAAPDLALVGCLAIALNAVGGAFVLASPTYAFAGIGPESLVLVLSFVAGMRVVYRQSSLHSALPVTAPAPPTSPTAPVTPTLRSSTLAFALATVVILVAAPTFAGASERIAELSGLGSTFVGTWLVGLSTSLPEVVTSVAAVRLGAHDLAVGNLFGSNAVNMTIFFAMDLAHPGEAIFGALDPLHALSALFAVVLMAVGIAAILFRAERRYALLEPSGALMVIIYLAGLWTLYLRSRPGI
jgi:cation:H+ antiporter